MKIFNSDIITALATPIGEGAISVIRVSGSGAIEKVNSIFLGKGNLETAKTQNYTLWKNSFQ